MKCIWKKRHVVRCGCSLNKCTHSILVTCNSTSLLLIVTYTHLLYSLCIHFLIINPFVFINGHSFQFLIQYDLFRELILILNNVFFLNLCLFSEMTPIQIFPQQHLTAMKEIEEYDYDILEKKSNNVSQLSYIAFLMLIKKQHL